MKLAFVPAPARMQAKVLPSGLSRQPRAWPEQTERATRWYDPEAVAGLIVEPRAAFTPLVPRARHRVAK